MEEDPVRGIKGEEYYKNSNGDGFFNDRNKRMNYFAVKAVLARVYLWEGSPANKAKALTIAENIIKEVPKDVISWIRDKDITNSYMANNDLTFSTEQLFVLDIKKMADNIMPYFNSANGTLYLEENMVNGLFEINAGIGGSDYRYKTLIQEYRKGCFYPIKLTQPYTWHLDFKVNRMPLIRITEMYYIAAECYATNVSPNLNEAIRLLDSVRIHRNISQKLSKTLTQTEVIKEIEKEYRKEFLTEGQLFFYYKRLGFSTIPNYEGEMSDETYMVPYPTEEFIYGNRVQ